MCLNFYLYLYLYSTGVAPVDEHHSNTSGRPHCPQLASSLQGSSSFKYIFSEIKLLPLPFPNTTCTVYFTEIQPLFLPKTNQGSKYIVSRCQPILGRCPHPGGGEIIPGSSSSLALADDYQKTKLIIVK